MNSKKKKIIDKIRQVFKKKKEQFKNNFKKKEKKIKNLTDDIYPLW